ncbi:MAG: leucine-rich repeat domain-containing protein [Methanobrevibacter sp.]|nr:leucine-rich repeat domain-containing protein [Methanosphaera sp.]MBR0369122.1 leucine-rich repeat domain-containing protein [Methanobrevibacter sp.]
MKFTGNEFISYNTNPFTYTGIITIDWGDNTIETYAGGALTHTYASNDNYTIIITGNISAINNATRYSDSTLTAGVFRVNGLNYVSLPSSIISIGDLSFYNNTDLTEIYLSKNIMTLGGNLFRGCTNLSEIIFPPNVTEIPKYCCYNCSNLISVVLPPNLITFTDYNCFSNCDLHSLDVPKTVTNIKYSYFNNNSNLTNVILNWDTSETILTLGDSNWNNNVCSTTIFSIPPNTTMLYYKKGYSLSQLIEREV